MPPAAAPSIFATAVDQPIIAANCPDCGVRDGVDHESGCTVAICMFTAKPREECDPQDHSAYGDEESPHGRDRWRDMPTPAFFAVKLGWWCRPDGQGGTVPCEAIDNGAVPDVDRLLRDAVYDPGVGWVVADVLPPDLRNLVSQHAHQVAQEAGSQVPWDEYAMEMLADQTTSWLSLAARRPVFDPEQLVGVERPLVAFTAAAELAEQLHRSVVNSHLDVAGSMWAAASGTATTLVKMLLAAGALGREIPPSIDVAETEAARIREADTADAGAAAKADAGVEA